MSAPLDPFTTRSIPDHVAQQVIARAIQLESDGASRMPIPRLREIAHEAGISADALQRALMELTSDVVAATALTEVEPVRYFRRLWTRLRSGPGAVDPASEPDVLTFRGALEAVATNLLAFVAFWVPALVVLVALRKMGLLESDAVDTLAVVTAIFGGAALAWRVRARLTFGLLALSGIGALVGLFSIISGTTPQAGFFGSSAFGWMLAAAFGTIFGVLLGRHTAAKSQSGGAAGTPPTLLSIVPTFERRRDTWAQGDGPFLKLGISEA